MLKLDRQRKILDLLQAKGSLSTATIIEELGFSAATVRRDLVDLDRQGLVEKVFGGITLPTGELVLEDETLESRTGKWQKEKDQMAKYAASLIKDGDHVYLDAGSSVLAMVAHLPDFNKVRYVTDSPTTASLLARRNLTVTMLPGLVKGKTDAVVGSHTVTALENYHFNKGFFGTNGIHKKNGLSTPDDEEAQVKRKALAHCLEKYLLADVSKLGLTAGTSFSRLSTKIHWITSSAGTKKDEMLQLKELLTITDLQGA